ncbi:hypothetical protein GOBAR_DD01370 [Gossypium barbadense]|nr:hypothetical protein GOBAR_DD01370 [Gossypium barbadense]
MKPGHLRRKGLLMTCTQWDQHDHNKQSCINSKQQDAQPPKQKGKSSIKRTTMSIMIASFQDGSGQTSSTP